MITWGDSMGCLPGKINKSLINGFVIKCNTNNDSQTKEAVETKTNS